MIVLDLTPHESGSLYAAQAQIADAIVRITRQRGKCQPEDLRDQGFADEQIQRNWPLALGLAAIALNWLEE